MATGDERDLWWLASLGYLDGLRSTAGLARL
jgi:hypothetical protein